MCLVRILFTFALTATIGFANRQSLRSLLADADASDEDVDRHVATIEALVQQDAVAGKELGRVSSRLLSTGMLSKRGTKRAQEHFKKWAKQYGGAVSP